MSTCDTKPGPLQQLVESFHSLLDESLIVAIANDYNLDDTSEFEAAFTILQGLAQEVPSEEATSFSPGSLHCLSEEQDGEDTRDAAAISATASEQASHEPKTDSSRTSHTCSDESSSSFPRVDVFNHENDETKSRQLQGLFPSLKKYDVEYSLRKAKGDFQTALDDLLNIQYLQSTGQQAKGIDIFFETQDQPVESSKKRRGKASSASHDLKPSQNQTSSPDFVQEFENQSEIAYIAERFKLSMDEVSVIYHETGCSNIATVLKILDRHISQHPFASFNEAQVTVIEGLRRRYRSLPEAYVQAIAQTTGTVLRFSDDIAVLTNKHFKQAKKQRLDMDYSLAPLPTEDTEQLQIDPGSKRSCASPSNLTHALQMSESFNQARRDAASSAASLHRKGASNPLYRQAASVYAARASEQAGYAQRATSAAADFFVEKQSTEDTIDLHGVSVQDGVRIARQKALDWWESRGKFRGEKKHERTLTIITGLGRHSVGGVSQLRRSVAAALLQDGWKVRVETGKFVVEGRY